MSSKLKDADQQTTTDEIVDKELKILTKKNNMKKPGEDRRPKRKKPGFHEEMFEETKYYFKKGLRFVYPYAFTFTAHIKKRWLDLKLIQLFEREFHMETLEYYENAIKIGKIKVNDEIVTRERILTGKDILKTIVHRHEPPVLHDDMEFLQNDDEMVVINKPASIPVHPCGRYRHNTIVFILGKEHGLERLHTIHRIDRLTSGILMFAKTPQKAKEMEKAVHGRNVEKEYMARVVGDFPSEEITAGEPLLTMSHKIGVCQVHADGKPCSTVFKKISFNGKSSLVRCRPHTGRMHQIRVHLQWLGHPIVNDPIYNHKTAWGEGKGKKGTTIDVKKVVAELIRTRKDKSYEENTAEDVTEKTKSSSSTNVGDVTGDGENLCKRQKLDDDSTTESSCQDNKLENTEEIVVREMEKDSEKEEKLLSNLETNTSSVDENCKNTVDSIVVKNNENDSQKEEILYENSNTKLSCEDVTCKSTEENIVGDIEKDLVKECIAEEEEDEEEVESYTSLDIGEQYHDPTCTECKRAWKEPRKSELVMYLHALSYKGPGWEYKTSLPYWAQDTWTKD